MKSSSLKLLIIGDVGGPDTYHAGDEAMLEANLAGFRQHAPGARFTVVSRDPEWTSKRYDTEAIEPIGFPDSTTAEKAAEERLEALLDSVSTGELPADFERAAQARIAIDSVKTADAVVVSGGGNLNATWPQHLYERVALLELAHRFETPAVVLGQTVGPRLTAAQARRLTAALGPCRLVGVRERSSRQLLQELEVPEAIIEEQLDDAVFLGRLVGGESRLGRFQRPYLALTLCGEISDLGSIAAQLGILADEAGLDIVFVPHARDPDRDRILGEQLASRLQTTKRFHLLDEMFAGDVAVITGGAELVISSRYHGLVFAAAAAVPALGLSADLYTRVKLEGALEHAGLGKWVLPIELAVGGLLLPAARELWQMRDLVRRQLNRVIPAWRADQERHWHRISRVLGSASAAEAETMEPEPRPAEVEGLEPEGFWRGAAMAFDRVLSGTRTELEAAREYAGALEQAHREHEAELASVKRVLEEHDIELTSVKRVFEEREREIESSREVVVNLEQEVERLQRGLDERNREIASVRQVLSARETEIEAQNAELDSVKPVLAAREEELTAVHAALADLRSELVSTREEVARVRASLAESERLVSAYRQSLVGRLARRLGRSPEDRST